MDAGVQSSSSLVNVTKRKAIVSDVTADGSGSELAWRSANHSQGPVLVQPYKMVFSFKKSFKKINNNKKGCVTHVARKASHAEWFSLHRKSLLTLE